MASIRRSTRLNSIGAGTATPSSHSQTAAARRSEIWHHRQQKVTAVSDEEKSEEEAENNENRNVMNKVERSGGQHRKSKKNLSSVSAYENEPKTPRSSKSSACTTPVSKKPELANKRKTALKIDTTDDEESDERKPHVSPPKQTRHSTKKLLPQQLISPTRTLLDRLSIDEPAESGTDSESDISSDVPATPTRSQPRNKYQNARRVLNSAETKQLPGRETQLQELRDFFTKHLNEQRSASLYVSGQPGTGKTACLSLLLRAPEFKQRLQRVYVNCTSIASIGSIYKKLCAELQLHPTGSTTRDYLAAILKYLRTAPRMLLLVLDEIDQLCSSRQEVLYTIFEWPALPKVKLLLVGIANSLDLTDRALMRLNARCELKPRLLHFPPYTKQQIVEIFKARLEQAGVLEVFPPVTLQLLAAKVSAVSGDVRRALDIGRRVVEIAEQQMHTGKREVNLNALNIEEEDEEPLKPVQVTQVAAVLNKVYGASQNLQEDIEESFPLQQKLMLCSLMLMLRKERNKDINMGRLHEVYRRVCAKRNIHALDHAEFSGIVDLVETRGILRIMRKKEPRLHKVLLQWDEEEVNGALCDKQLIASILDDTACLSK